MAHGEPVPPHDSPAPVPARPHCTRCGHNLYYVPDNAFGWCLDCEAAARVAGLPATVPQPCPHPGSWGPNPWSDRPWWDPSHPLHVIASPPGNDPCPWTGPWCPPEVIASGPTWTYVSPHCSGALMQ